MDEKGLKKALHGAAYNQTVRLMFKVSESTAAATKLLLDLHGKGTIYLNRDQRMQLGTIGTMGEWPRGEDTRKVFFFVGYAFSAKCLSEIVPQLESAELIPKES